MKDPSMSMAKWMAWPRSGAEGEGFSRLPVLVGIQQSSSPPFLTALSSGVHHLLSTYWKLFDSIYPLFVYHLFILFKRLRNSSFNSKPFLREEKPLCSHHSRWNGTCTSKFFSSKALLK